MSLAWRPITNTFVGLVHRELFRPIADREDWVPNTRIPVATPGRFRQTIFPAARHD